MTETVILLGGRKTRGDSETDYETKEIKKKKYARKEKQAYEIEATLMGKFKTFPVREICLWPR